MRACVLFIEATIMIEKQQEALFEIQLCEFASIVSTMLAIFGVHTLARLVSVNEKVPVKETFVSLFRINFQLMALFGCFGSSTFLYSFSPPNIR